jgi:hypothetical protein
MPDLNFQIEGVEAVAFAASPQLAFKLRIVNAVAEEVIHTVALRCQVQMEAARRRYSAETQASLLDLFGEPERWSRTLRTLLWTHVSVIVPAFRQSTVVDLPVPCTFDFNVAATKYFHGLSDGEVPLCLQFSGTVFYAQFEGSELQVAPISWEKETRFKLPVNIWQQMMDSYYPNSAWLSLRRDVFERLYHYKVSQGIPTWEEALERVLPVEAGVAP